MQINYYGWQCFRFRWGATSLVTDPFLSSLGSSLPKFSAQIGLVSSPAAEWVDTSRLKDDVFIISAQGEYEINGVWVKAVQIEDGVDPKLIYLISAEGITAAFLGGLEHELEAKHLAILENIDVLLFPLARPTWKPQQASSLVSSIDPAVAIPFQEGKTLPSLDEFQKIQGIQASKAEKLVLAKTSLPEETELIVLQA